MVYGMYVLYEMLDWESMKKYVENVKETVEQYGGQYLATDPNVEVIEGRYDPKHTVLIAFPTREMLGKWYESPEYQDILPYRLKGARGAAVVVHGVSG
jgi:uncharacterized protein (DUF1330 family)